MTGVISGGSTRAARTRDGAALALPPNPPDGSRRRLLVASASLLVVALAVACSDHSRGGYRRAHREYDGAPPVVPHQVRALNRQDCLACHKEGLDLGARGLSPRAPHPERVNCLQCHVEQLDSSPGLAANSFAGVRHPARGTRAYAGAPPTLPHPRNGREGCLGCHGEKGGSPIHTPHADRVNCLQCHVEQADVAPFMANSFGGVR